MQTIEQALTQAQLYTDEAHYCMVKLPVRAITAAAALFAEIGEAFLVLIADKDEVTLILDSEAYEEYQRRLLGHEAAAQMYRLITFDVALEPTLIGFMARVSAALAQAGVPIFPFAAYTRDHILVPADKFDDAMAALRALQKLAS
jgi:hypothetical protein